MSMSNEILKIRDQSLFVLCTRPDGTKYLAGASSCDLSNAEVMTYIGPTWTVLSVQQADAEPEEIGLLAGLDTLQFTWAEFYQEQHKILAKLNMAHKGWLVAVQHNGKKLIVLNELVAVFATANGAVNRLAYEIFLANSRGEDTNSAEIGVPAPIEHKCGVALVERIKQARRARKPLRAVVNLGAEPNV